MPWPELSGIGSLGGDAIEIIQQYKSPYAACRMPPRMRLPQETLTPLSLLSSARYRFDTTFAGCLQVCDTVPAVGTNLNLRLPWEGPKHIRRNEFSSLCNLLRVS